MDFQLVCGFDQAILKQWDCDCGYSHIDNDELSVSMPAIWQPVSFQLLSSTFKHNGKHYQVVMSGFSGEGCLPEPGWQGDWVIGAPEPKYLCCPDCGELFQYINMGSITKALLVQDERVNDG